MGPTISIYEPYNEFWKYPSINEKPKGFFGIDGGCYWAPDHDN